MAAKQQVKQFLLATCVMVLLIAVMGQMKQTGLDVIKVRPDI